MRAPFDLLPSPQIPPIAGPGLHLRWRWGWVKGWVYRVGWTLGSLAGGPKVSAGHRLSIQGRLRVRGPGRIVLGDDVVIDGATDLYTHSADAVIRVGARSFLNGSRLGCQSSIEFGELCIVGDARLMDTDFHSVAQNRHARSAIVRVAPIRVGRGVWIAAGSAVLPGVTIGDGSVVGFGSVVTQDIAPSTLAVGNPARAVGPVPLV